MAMGRGHMSTAGQLVLAMESAEHLAFEVQSSWFGLCCFYDYLL